MPRPLPKSREARKKLILKNSKDFCRRMSSDDIRDLLTSLGHTQGLEQADVEGLQDGLFNVAWEWVPDYLKE